MLKNYDEQLRRDVESLSGSPLNIEYVAADNSYGLSMDSPAMVTKEDMIYILSTLPIEFRNQAEAHELGHLYLKYSGLIRLEYPFDYGYPVSEDFLALEINNALSHIHLIHLLEHNYGISSQLHLDLLGSSLEYVPDQILDCRLDEDIFCLHGIGVALYDIERTIPRFSSLVKDIASMDPSVSHALQEARKNLSLIEPNMGQDQQIKLI